MNNLWMSDILERIRPVVSRCSSSDLPTYLVMDGRRIPFEVVGADLVMKENGFQVDSLDIYLKRTDDVEAKG